MSREIGSLRALSNGESQYVGSSSGVFFINTVRRAFATATVEGSAGQPERNDAGAQPTGNPSPEDCIVGSEDQIHQNPVTPGLASQEQNGSSRAVAGLNHESPWDAAHAGDLRKMPDYTTARQLVMTYFRIWHPLVPFLNGPICLAELDALYAGDESGNPGQPSTLSQAVIYRCIFNIASLDNPDLSSLGPAKICSPSELLPVLGLLALRCDIASIQALLCAQLYFVATMSLRNASTVGGLVSKSIVQSGFHRCPHRYAHLTPDDRSMRKRMFWSAYVLDRFLSQSLGHPNGIQDSDIDVCPAGARDLHEPVMQSVMSPSSAVGDDTILHLPVNHPERRAASPRLRGRDKEGSARGESDDAAGSDSEAINAASDEPAAVSQHRREVQAVLASHVQYSQLIGRMLEIFHKSIHVRATDSRAVLYLKADIGAWGNSLEPPRFVGTAGQQDPKGRAPDPTIFPFVSYQYSLLLANRPSLSLEPDSAEFHSAIQACIAAGTSVLQTLEKYSELGNPLFWPGYMSAVWMSGLVLAFAAQLDMFSMPRAISGISSALKLLTVMTSRWHMARHCKSVLSSLIASLQAKTSGRKRGHQESEMPHATHASRSGTSIRGSQVSNGAPSGGPGRSKRRNTGSRGAYPQFTPSRFSIQPRQPVDPAFSPQSSATVFPPPSFRNDPTSLYQPDFHASSGHPGNWRGHFENSSMHRSALNPPYHSGMRFPGQYPDESYHGFASNWEDPSYPSPSYPKQHQMPIPTIFPERRGAPPDSNATLVGDSVFDVFDGATWGSLLDIVDNPHEEHLF